MFDNYNNTMIEETRRGLMALLAKIEHNHESSYDLDRILTDAINEVEALADMES